MELEEALIFSVLVTLLWVPSHCSGLSAGNLVREEDSRRADPRSAASGPAVSRRPSAGPVHGWLERLDSPAGREEEGKKGEGNELEKISQPEVDEDTIRKAEKMANRDLLNGLNRILKNNETLKDVLLAENVYEIL